jgi:photosystem II stability/assembly factor-like uncharacterized protein
LAWLVAGAGAAPVTGALDWRELGPFRGGWATMVVGVPSLPNTYYFGAADGGVWRTDDAGRTWQARFQHGPAASIGAIAVAPSNPDVLYIGTGQPEPRYDIAGGAGVFRSSDGGASWTDLGLAETRHIGRILISPTDPNTVLVAAQGRFFAPDDHRGVYRSTDGGRNWSHVLSVGPTTGAVDLAADPAHPSVVFAAAWDVRLYPWQSYFTPEAGPGSGIYRSDDGGATWRRLSGGGFPQGSLGRISLATADTARGLRVYASVDGGGDAKRSGLYRSDDGGATWSRVNDGDAFTNAYASRVTVAPDDPDVVYTVGQSIRRCGHGGADCVIIKGSPGGDDYHSVWINPDHPDHMITGSDQGAVVTVDGGRTWSSWYNQPTAQFYHLAADDRFPYWIYSGQQDSGTVAIASRSDYGVIGFRDWHPVGGDERDDDIPDPADPHIVYGSGLGGRVTKWDARTGQVQNIAPWPVSSYGKRATEVKFHYLWVTPLAVSRTGPFALYLGAQVLFRSLDRGATWSIISPDLTGKTAGATNCGGTPSPAEAKACGYGSIAAVEPSPRHAGEIWVGTDDGLIWTTGDAGRHWRDVTPPGLPLWAKVASLSVSAQRDGTVYAAVDGQRLGDLAPHVLRTTDGGKTWQEIASGLPAGQFVDVVREDPVRAGLLYAGTGTGVFVSLDDGGAWSSLQRNLPTTWVRDLLVHGDDLIAATQGRGIWVLDDVTPLRQAPASLGQEPVHLFTPAPAFRVHADNNADTPPPPETPLGRNPPAGAVIDYWLGAAPKGPVVLEIRDETGAVVRRFASNETPKPVDAELYFAKAWTRPPAPLAASAGMHRFVWDLRYERPQAIHYTYSIAAIWGQDTPATPLGPMVLPGKYTAVLSAGGQTRTAGLTVREDPRVAASLADMRASLALSRRIGPALQAAWVGAAESAALRKQIGALTGDAKAAAKDGATSLGAAIGTGPDSFDAIDTVLGAIETDLEGTDAAPTAAQETVVTERIGALEATERRWAAWKADTLPGLNASVAKAGGPRLTVPPRDRLTLAAPDPGDDLP